MASSNTGLAPTGLVTFLTSASVLGTAALVTSNGTTSATFSPVSPGLGVGLTSVTAVYSGDTSNAGSMSAALLQMVAQAATSTTVTSSSSSSVFGQSVTFSATISPTTSGTPSGLVIFQDGGRVLGDRPARQE